MTIKPSTLSFSLCIPPLLSVYAIYCWYDPATWFTFHPTSLLFSFLFSMPIGLLLETGAKRASTHYYHAVVNGIAVLAAGFGYYVIYSNKELAGKAHVTSWHAVLGIVALILLGIQVGIAITKVSPFVTPRDRRPWKDMHLKLGLLVWLAGCTTAFTGFYKTTYSTSALVAATAAVLTAATIIARTRISW
uniref:Cytochrome b561 domain-containing protein n=1 Tax=Sexangularia sp. CB-2014 TaxID=1486929 RepID=A0A7S1VG34_9EUKA|mmetsp:Transcript_1884/g.5987  ORF Transcript_1884/g.5987 Transcript_1884/m.5987 type:complete len:190 (+) Transcript_1884:91-660(+)